MTELVQNAHSVKNWEIFEVSATHPGDAYNTLFSSMLSFAELYLANALNRTKSEVKGNSKKDSKIFTRTKNNIARLFSRKEENIERMLETESIQNLDAKSIDTNIFDNSGNDNKEENKYASKNILPFTKFLKGLYSSFVNYSKKAYEALSSSSKKVDGFVKLTIYKIIKIGEYIMALTCPQWNKVMGSPEDLDTHAVTMSQKESVSQENAKYEIGYPFLRYRA